MSRYPGASRFMKKAGALSTTLENSNKSASKAQQVIRAQELSTLGAQAYSGEFIGTGVIDKQFQDHGVGENILSFNDVTFGDRAVGSQFYYMNRTSLLKYYNANTNTVTSPALGTTAMEQQTDLNTVSGYQNLAFPTNAHTPGSVYVWSVYVVSSGGRTGTANLRVVSYPTLADAQNDTNRTTLALGSTVNIGGTVQRLSVSFIAPATGAAYISLQVRSTRQSGAAAGTVQGIARWGNQMLEEVQFGQAQPSKFTLPTMEPGDLTASMLEGESMLGFISGMTHYKAGTNVYGNLTQGRCYIPGIGHIVNLNYDITLAGPGANGRYYVYAFEDDTGTVAFEYSPTTPSLYTGNARIRGIDRTRRYIGYLPRYLGDIPNFMYDGNLFLYFDDINNRQVLTNGASQTNTNIDCSQFAPQHARVLLVLFNALGTNTSNITAWIANPTDGLSPAAGQGQNFVTLTANQTARSRFVAYVVCSGTQQLQYAWSGAGGQLNMYVLGFIDPR